MIRFFIYFMIVLAATTAGAMTGMGGGVIIKPALDVLKDYDVTTIGVLSSISVFTMAMVSVIKQIQQKAKIQYDIAIPLALGSIAGGIAGERILAGIVSRLHANELVLVVQNILLALLIIGVFFYMLNKSKIRSLGVTNPILVLAVGLFLGLISSFLGIGGGPINVALLIYVFSFDTKTAAVCSIITILFAQISKLSSLLIGGKMAALDLSMLLPMVSAAVLGGLMGSKLNKRLPEKTVVIAFNGVQIMVFCICIYNIIVNLG